jgi:toxin ParE1/3/4
MPRQIRFHPAALQDAEGATAWYGARSTRSAARFLEELDRLLEVVATVPEQFPKTDSGPSRALFRRFPFFLAFRIDSENVVIFAVAHGKRRPHFWRDRL